MPIPATPAVVLAASIAKREATESSIRLIIARGLTSGTIHDMQEGRRSVISHRAVFAQAGAIGMDLYGPDSKCAPRPAMVSKDAT